MLPYSLNKLFSETNSSRLTFESTKYLEIKTSMVLNLSFANNSVLSCSLFFSS